MPVEVFEDSLELQIGILEAVIPDNREDFGASYPYPVLRATDRLEQRRFRIAVLENDFLRATFAPDLGGRLISVLDKRSNSEAIPQTDYRPTFDSVRHAGLPNGLQITLSGQDRHNSMGSVAYAAEPDEHLAGLWFAEVTGPISWHAHWQLATDEAQLQLEVRAFNRTLLDQPYVGGLLVWAPGSKPLRFQQGAVVWNSAKDSGLVLSHSESVMQSPRQFMGHVIIARAPAGFQLAPRQMDSYQLLLQPFGSMGEPVACAETALMGRNINKISLRTGQLLSKGKLVLQTHSGETLEAPADLTAGSRFEAELPPNVSELALLDAQKQVLLRHRIGEGLEIPSEDEPSILVQENGNFDPEATEQTLRSQVLHQHLKAPAHTSLALQACKRGAYGKAADQLEQALLYNGEDHLNWWFKAALQRLDGAAENEQPELLNAHFLAPLEPALRAESFLAQPIAGDRAPNPILRPLEDTPEAFVEVACLLLEANLYQEANRWIDEALRHLDLAMLRYLQAYALMQGSRMQADAASQIAAAGRLEFGPPFPWRKIEVRALRALADAFPQDPVLEKFVQLVSRD